MKRDTLTRIEEQAALYALGVLGRTEALLFEEEIAAGNQEAAASLEVFDHLVADLAFGAPEVAPPARVRERLLHRIAGEPATESNGDEQRKRELSLLASRI